MAYAVTQCPAPPVLYNFTAAASWALSGAFAGDTPLYLAGATESQVDCKNWYLPAAPDVGFTAWILPPDSRWAICFRWAFTFTDEPSDAFDSVGVAVTCELFDVNACGCWVWAFCGASTYCDCTWLAWTADGATLLVAGACALMSAPLAPVAW